MREVVVSSLTASQGPALEICKGAARSHEAVVTSRSPGGPALEICKGAARSREPAAPLHSPMGPLRK